MYFSVFVHDNILKMAIFEAPSSTPEGDRHAHPLIFCSVFNDEQLLFEAFSHIMRIFGSVEPQTESNFPFQYNIIFETYQSSESSSSIVHYNIPKMSSFDLPSSTLEGDRQVRPLTFWYGIKC